MREEDQSNVAGGWTDAFPRNLTCQFCGKTSHNVVNYRQRTQYADESDNWANACPECKAKNDEHWDEMWADLYEDIRSGVGL